MYIYIYYVHTDVMCAWEMSGSNDVCMYTYTDTLYISLGMGGEWIDRGAFIPRLTALGQGLNI